MEGIFTLLICYETWIGPLVFWWRAVFFARHVVFVELRNVVWSRVIDIKRTCSGVGALMKGWGPTMAGYGVQGLCTLTRSNQYIVDASFLVDFFLMLCFLLFALAIQLCLGKFGFYELFKHGLSTQLGEDNAIKYRDLVRNQWFFVF
jgi:hypothetical protein